MTVKELIKKLQEYPENLEVWVSDRGYVEGGIKLEKVEKVLAVNAGLDGDDIDDEYNSVEDVNVKECLSKGYFLTEDKEYVSKEIVYLNDIE